MGNCGSSSGVKKQRDAERDVRSAGNSTVGGMSQSTKAPLSSSTLTESTCTSYRIPAGEQQSRVSSRSLRIVLASPIPPADANSTAATRDEHCAAETAPAVRKRDPITAVPNVDVSAGGAPIGLPHSPPPANGSFATPFTFSQFAYPESPQLLCPRNGEMSCRQRTGSLPPYTVTPSSPPASIVFPNPASPNDPRAHVGVTKELIEQLQCQLVAERSSSERHASNKPTRSRTHSRTSSPSRSSSRRQGSDTASNDEQFVAMRKHASIQNVLTWMESGSTLCREESNYSHMITASPTDGHEGDAVAVAVAT